MAEQTAGEKQRDEDASGGTNTSTSTTGSEDEQSTASSENGSSEENGSSSGDNGSSSGDNGSSEQESKAPTKDEKAPAKDEKAPAKDEKAPEKEKAPKEKAEKEEAPKEKAAAPSRGQADTTWAEPEGKRRLPTVDIGEVIWRGSNVLATVVRTICLLFALVLVVNLVFYLVGVNPANTIASFVATVAVAVILGFRTLFVPADPTTGVIVNSLIAAVFWAFLGELLSRLIRFLAARAK